MVNTSKGAVMSWFKHKPPKYPPHRHEPAPEPVNQQPKKEK
jgi:hypothetical protein